jgi:galactokinase
LKIEFDKNYFWSNYLKGVLWALKGAGVPLRGLDLAFRGNVPRGGGLSSSAALEVITALTALKLYGVTFEITKIALLCQKAENDFIGMKCGVMDQFASLAGSEGHALFLDCRTLAYDRIPLDLGGYRIVICHSGVKHELVTSEYNVRRQNCTDGVAILKKHFPEITALRNVTPEMLERYRSEMAPEIYRRCYHVITENERVLGSIEAMRRGDLERFGRLMNDSHDSQRDYFEVSCPEIDLLVDLARQAVGVLGARLTGGGFGGCTVNLVAADAIARFETEVAEAYRKQTGIEPKVFVSTPRAGAKIDE